MTPSSMTPQFAAAGSAAIPLHVIETEALADWLTGQADHVRRWVDANGFTAARGQALLIPGQDGAPEMALAGYADAAQRARHRHVLAGAVQTLPAGTYAIASGLEGQALANECFGWLISSYNFSRYRDTPTPEARALIAPSGIDTARIEALAAAECLTRDLINTPSSDMGPAELEGAARALAREFDAEITVIEGDALLEQNFPMIHAVGRASPRAPRLIDLHWGDTGPKLTLVGKGVCFDTGGLDLKPAASMALMKKDMGGAATVLGLARSIMALGLPLQLRVLIPAVENAVAGNAFRPGDILTSRKGLTVEINNTDAEGRLVLADALALAAEGRPDLIVSMATLTGAARVAVGADIAPFFTDDEIAAGALAQAGPAVADPVWRLPFHEPYELKIEPGIADLDNAPGGGFGGAITAALFLRRFAGPGRYVHFDIYAWSQASTPARPKGALVQGARAVLDALPAMLSL
ncbi:leucyl aminopeptidase [Pseudodonghicola xiamenensis]|uniref:Leucyl aminopeptidase n=2 Tax=Pseudodonghicola xiamenensis TaxID=337702 RepID=A0A8J3HBT4_9RHOB|nr:leucyl aminopeptidase [Pseudodonghicola xiamenensis]